MFSGETEGLLFVQILFGICHKRRAFHLKLVESDRLFSIPQLQMYPTRMHSNVPFPVLFVSKTFGAHFALEILFHNSFAMAL